MPTALVADQGTETLEDVVKRLGGIELRRIRSKPPPGTATERDMIAANDSKKGLCELVDGVLVEKAMGYYESRLAAVLCHMLENFLDKNDLGIVLVGDGPIRLRVGLTRLPDVSFISWEHFPGRVLPSGAVLDKGPDLAVEMLSPGNTKAEMQRKVKDYFAAGARLVWLADPKKRQVVVYTSPEKSDNFNETQALNGGDVLPGFSLSINDWFARAGQKEK